MVLTLKFLLPSWAVHGGDEKKLDIYSCESACCTQYVRVSRLGSFSSVYPIYGLLILIYGFNVFSKETINFFFCLSKLIHLESLF